MNYLAHIYLSGENDFIKIGNFMADGVKGNKYNNYQPDIKKGILLHRQIDSFTDTNDIVKMSKRRLNNRYGLYRGVIIDIFYDHFLAKKWSDYSQVELQHFTSDFYQLLDENKDVLTPPILRLMPYMVKDDWLTNYASIEGIEKVLIGMNRKTGGNSQMDLAIQDLLENYVDFEQDFVLFFDKVRPFCELKLKELNTSIE